LFIEICAQDQIAQRAEAERAVCHIEHTIGITEAVECAYARMHTATLNPGEEVRVIETVEEATADAPVHMEEAEIHNHSWEAMKVTIRTHGGRVMP
jgi:hypothetical protein